MASQHDSQTIYDRAGKVLYRSEGGLSGARLGGDLTDADLRGADLTGVNMEGVTLMGADLTDANLEGANLYWCLACEAVFERADLRRASFRGATLEKADFRYARLQGADFGGDKLSGRDARLAGALFACAEYDAATVFPEGFDPHVAGMIETDVG